jgi:hypothetical protein
VRSLLLTKPIGQIQNDSRKKRSFGYSEQKTNDVKLSDALHETGGHSHNAPTEQNSGDPDARPDLMQQEIARNFKDDIADEENPGYEPKLPTGDSQFLVHRQGGKPNIDAVDKRDDVKNEQKGKKPDLQLVNSSGADRYAGRGCFTGQSLPRCQTALEGFVTDCGWLKLCKGVANFIPRKDTCQATRSFVRSQNAF